MKRKKIALYDPYLDVLGGGERHILSILKVLQDEGYDPVIFWDKNLTAEIKEKLHFTFKPEIEFIPNIFTQQLSALTRIQKLRQYDDLLYVTDGSYFYSSAKKNFIFCMVPQKSLYKMTLLNTLKTYNATFISNSYYTKNLLQSWGVDSHVVYPYIQEEFFNTYTLRKEKIILVVGRFFNHLHAKRQDLAIQWFKLFQSQNATLANYKLILAGSCKKEDEGYVNELKQLAGNDPSIEFHLNVSFDELLTLYKRAKIYWHLAGYGIDEKQYPEKVEHLGITPLEAMAAGCLVFAINAGGLKEIIRDGKTGYLISSHEELFSKMGYTLFDDINYKIICTQANQFVKDTFSYSVFSEHVKKIML